jgi:hypothetical protein
MASDVTRWANASQKAMILADDGLFVKYADYAELEAQLAGKWISVKDGYPVPGSIWLVWFGNAPTPYMDVWIYDGSNQYFRERKPGPMEQCVTHYCRRPEPPTKEASHAE